MASIDLTKQKKQRLAELEQSFLMAMRQSKYEEALRFAQTALELEPTAPSTARYKDFIPLLQEKVALDETDDESDDAGEGAAVAGGAGAAGAGAGAEEAEEDDEDEDDSEDEEESEEEGEGEEAEAASEAPSIPDIDSIALDATNLRMSKDARSKLRSSLAKSIKDLKEKELQDKIKASDPLLGA